MQGPTTDAKLAARVYRIVTSSVLRRDQPNSGESCIMLQSWPTRNLVAKFLQRLVITCSMQISCCRERTLRMRPRMGVCKLWCLISWRPKRIRTITAQWTYLQIHYARIQHGRGYMENLKKLQNCQNLGDGRLLGYGRLLGTIQYCYRIKRMHLITRFCSRWWPLIHTKSTLSHPKLRTCSQWKRQTNSNLP